MPEVRTSSSVSQNLGKDQTLPEKWNPKSNLHWICLMGDIVWFLEYKESWKSSVLYIARYLYFTTKCNRRLVYLTLPCSLMMTRFCATSTGVHEMRLIVTIRILAAAVLPLQCLLSPSISSLHFTHTSSFISWTLLRHGLAPSESGPLLKKVGGRQCY